MFSDQPQVAYIQQDGTTQQVSQPAQTLQGLLVLVHRSTQKKNAFHLQVTVLLPGGQNMNAANLHVLSNVAEAPQAILEPVSEVRTWRFGRILKRRRTKHDHHGLLWTDADVWLALLAYVCKIVAF